MIGVFIVGIIFMALSIIGILMIDSKSTSKLSECGFLCIAGLVLGTVMIFSSLINRDPQAIDVYRNKTELQIHYQIQGLDTLSKDTIVVWKKIN
jgi:hypothetical protein